MKTVAWTGGSLPEPYPPSNPQEHTLCDSILAASVECYTKHWGEPPCREILQTMTTHASYDAHATIREGIA